MLVIDVLIGRGICLRQDGGGAPRGEIVLSQRLSKSTVSVRLFNNGAPNALPAGLTLILTDMRYDDFSGLQYVFDFRLGE